MTEKIFREQDSDWIRCVPSCNNESHMDGFYPCTADGTEIEPVGGPGGWGSDGRYRLVCARCGRIIDQFTREVLGFAEVPVADQRDAGDERERARTGRDREADSIDVLYRVLRGQLH